MSPRRVPGEVGVWIFILGDMVAFAVMFGILVWVQGNDPALYEASQSELHVGLGVLNTILLLSSSLAVALGVRATRGPDPARAARFFAVAIGCAVAFAACKVFEYTDLGTSGVSARTSDFFLYYFTFTGIHLLHVAIGVVVLAGVMRIARRGVPTERDGTMVESGTSYWHMVDLLWIALFALLYLFG